MGVGGGAPPLCRQLSIRRHTPRCARGAVSVSAVLVPVSPGQGHCSCVRSLCLDQGLRGRLLHRQEEKRHKTTLSLKTH